jgi:hypothetical protein
MERIEIQATARTPRLVFDPSQFEFLLEGESYPEDTRKFYDAPMNDVSVFLENTHAEPIKLVFKLKYFNSSSAKVLMDLFLAVEESAGQGNQITVEWHYAKDDDNMQELGEEFSEELSKAQFALIAF